MSWLLSPLGWLIGGLLIALLAAAVRRPLICAGGVLFAVLGVVAMTPLAANLLVQAIESRANAAGQACSDPQAVVLLSGGLQRVPDDRDDYAALTPASIERIFGLLRQPHAYAVPLLISGGGPYSPAEAEVLGQLLVRLGFDRRALLRESWSDTTWSNATEVRGLLPVEVTRIALATSALHMPRARLAFERVGFEPCALVLSSMHVDAGGIGAFVPQSSSLLKSERAMYELAGELWYRLRIAWAHGFDGDHAAGGAGTPPL